MRRFCAERGLRNLPRTLRRYRFAAMPPYLAPLTWLCARWAGSTPGQLVGIDVVTHTHLPNPV
jgi:hypothetical protein